MEGELKTGRPCREWLDDINEGVVRKFTYSAERSRITARLERWCVRHWTPTGAEPTKQWMDVFIYVRTCVYVNVCCIYVVMFVHVLMYVFMYVCMHACDVIVTLVKYTLLIRIFRVWLERTFMRLTPRV